MKINKKTKLAVKQQVRGATPAVAKMKKSKASKPVKGKLAKKFKAVALVTGQRGGLVRWVEVSQFVTGETEVIALQNENGLSVKNPVACAIIGGKLVGEKQGRVQLGGYVNGRNTGASVQLLTEAEFAKKSLPCNILWNKDGEAVSGRYIGNPNVKGIVAVFCKFGNMPYYWQVEIDSNANNAHERGHLEPLKKGEKLSACK